MKNKIFGIETYEVYDWGYGKKDIVDYVEPLFHRTEKSARKKMNEIFDDYLKELKEEHQLSEKSLKIIKNEKFVSIKCYDEDKDLEIYISISVREFELEE